MTEGRKRAFVWIFILFLIQNAWSSIFPQFTPPLLLIGVVFYALSGGVRYGFLVGLYAGAFFEVFGVGAIGWQMAVFGVIGALSGGLSSKFFVESRTVQLILPPAADLLAAMLSFLLMKNVLWGQGAPIAASFSELYSLKQFLLAAFASPPVFAWLGRVGARRQVRRAGVWR